MIKALLVDDEKRGIENIHSLLATYCSDITVIGEAQSIKKAEELIKHLKPDVVFLDIEMPGGNGFELLEKIQGIEINVIFVTAYNSYAVDAFKANAINYLLKPIDSSLLVSAVKQLKKYIGDNISNIDSAISSLNAAKETSRIRVPTLNGFELISPMDILYIQSSGSYSQLILRNGNKILLSKNIGTMHVLLKDHLFFRSHREYIINLKEVNKYTKGRGGHVVLSNGKSIPVAVRRKSKLLTLLGEN